MPLRFLFFLQDFLFLINFFVNRYAFFGDLNKGCINSLGCLPKGNGIDEGISNDIDTQ